MVTKVGGINWEMGIDIHTAIYKTITNKKLLYGSSIQYSVMN